MNIHILQELQPYSIQELQSIFSVENSELEAILNSLSLMNISKMISSNFSKIKLEELLEIDNLDDLNFQFQGEVYVFKYVGILLIGQTCLIIYPKYAHEYLMDVNNNYKTFKQLIAVIRKYESKEQKLGFNNYKEVENFNMISLTLDLIFNYYEHGLYSNNKEIIEENGYGEILWEKTISENIPYFSKNIPIYLNTFTTNQETNEQDFFRRLHAFVITDSCRRLKDILQIIDIDYINISSEKFQNFGTEEYVLYRLNQELSSQFITYRQNTLQLIKQYIEQKNNRNMNLHNISFVGTSNFNLVWEDVCSVVMGNCLDKSIEELGFTCSKENSVLLSEIIAKPLWQHKESGKTYVSKKTLEPDIVSIKNGKLSIYDAKYYKIKLDENGVRYQPGIADITKQYLYELAYKKFAKENNLIIENNAFLMPSEEKEEKKIGTVKIEIFDDLGNEGFKDIEVILKPSDKMYTEYLKF